MKIEFPCPVTRQELSPSSNGLFCSFCSKEVLSIDGIEPDKVKKLIAENDEVCISTVKRNVIHSGPSLRKFALSLLIVFGASLFRFADAQLLDRINSVKMSDSAVCKKRMLEIICVDQNVDTISSSVEVVLEMPNGKELKPLLEEDNTYLFEVPAFVVGKSIVIHADRFGKKKTRKVEFLENSVRVVEEIKFNVKTNRSKYQYRTIGCPSF
ncbi:hypothetical protein [Parvicella tangerina]|uniref:Uncharacterized protein n=1 Tax=Parvicella tangerina TaxID=2829795 RepID=A0A916JQ56_9FLAO|nr:hypothetical protein [Parvicella tangerina]CAG5085419.1 hypothetical protein CRYO30217_02754 [Parvicella tangerina]